MDKVANFINNEYYREALARLCRIAQWLTQDERLVLDDWENLHLNHFHSDEEKADTIKKAMECFGNDKFTISSDETREILCFGSRRLMNTAIAYLLQTVLSHMTILMMAMGIQGYFRYIQDPVAVNDANNMEIQHFG